MYSHGPIVLVALSQFKSALHREELENAWNGLINIYINNVEIALRLKERMVQAKAFSTERIEEIQRSFKTGELLTNRLVPDSKLFRLLGGPGVSMNRHNASWRPDNYDYRWEQFKQIPEIYGFDWEEDIDLWTIERDGHRVLYLFCALSKPYMRDVWSDWVNECWYVAHQVRLREVCNRKFATESTVETLMMEHMHDRFRRLAIDRDAMREYMVSN
jgi:hypothetical protein